MDIKRKANGTATPETEYDRAAKRRKLASEYDLSKGESRPSTTAYGLAFLEQIRRTQDKSGRAVATYFEKLPTKDEEPEYYKKTRLPISLETIDQKLNDGEFRNLSELESYFKRMISNAKEYYPRSSPVFDDAERIRKAVSNYMTKTNPAYLKRGYQALPTPLPPEDDEEAADDEEEEDGDEEGEEDAEGDDDDEAEAEAEAEAEEEEEEEEDDEDEEEEAEEEPTGRSSRKRSIVLKRSRPGRPSRQSVASVPDTPTRSASQTRPDHQYEDVPYKGLSFQQAQEKIVEELLRYQEPDYESPYYEPFVNLPPRALKDYYKTISDPLSLKKLQKIVKGVQGRGDPTNVSEFKSWSQFEEKAKLLWTNAYFYNEEGSEIYSLAQELEESFMDELKQAQAVVPEPAQAKIKLKVGQQAEQQGSSKKITLHVGSRGGESTEAASRETDSPTPAQDVNGAGTHTQMTLAPIDKVRNASASGASPRTAVVRQDGFINMSAVNVPRPSSGDTAAAQTPQPAPVPVPVVQPPPGPVMEQKRLRPAGKGVESALISKVLLYTQLSAHSDRPSLVTILPDPKTTQQSITLNLPAIANRVMISVTLPPSLEERQYSLWTLMDKQTLKPTNQVGLQQINERVFDAALHPGLNIIEAHLIAAIPRDDREAEGPETELEVFTVLANVART